MAGVRLGDALRRMQALLGAGTFSGLSDGELLERFLEPRDDVAELAFAVLVERHGPMVLGVCRRILDDPHDADDAFQATFLVLARRGGSVRVEGSLGRWLFGVATRVATRARGDLRRRRARERSGLERVEAAEVDSSLAGLERAEVAAAVVREVADLPDRFQAPVILCDLQGASCEEAARRLGWPVGTVKSRLSRARARLRERLTRRGLAPADLSMVPTMLRAAPSAHLVEATTRIALALISGQLTTAAGISMSVARLTQGVLHTMIITRLKLATAALVLVGIGTMALFGQASAQRAGRQAQGPSPATASAKPDSVPKSDDQVDIELLERAWAEAITRRDAAVVGRVLSEDFEGVDEIGRLFTKASYLSDLGNGRFAPWIGLDDIKVRFFGETAVVISQIKSTSSPMFERTTKVYIKRNGRWRCVAAHAGGFRGVTNCPAIRKPGGGERLDHWLTIRRRAESQRGGETQNRCITCHSQNVPLDSPFEHPGGGPPAPPAVSTAGDGKGRPGKALHVEIDAAGQITIEGKPVAADKKDLEARLRIGRGQTGRDDLILSAAAETPYRIVAMVTAAAQFVGLRDIYFKPMEKDYRGRNGR